MTTLIDIAEFRSARLPRFTRGKPSQSAKCTVRNSPIGRPGTGEARSGIQLPRIRRLGLVRGVVDSRRCGLHFTVVMSRDGKTIGVSRCGDSAESGSVETSHHLRRRRNGWMR